MATPASILLRHPGPDPRIVPDRRRHKRYPLNLLGRFMRANKQEYPCKLCNISVGGIAVASPVTVESGERIIAYFDHIGGLEGHVVRVYDGGFAVRLNASLHKREKLAAQVTWLLTKDELEGVVGRRHERIAVVNKASMLTLADGSQVETKMLDVSLSGASLGTEARPPLGGEVMLGKLRCRVMRHHERGIGVQFLDIQEPEALRRYFG